MENRVKITINGQSFEVPIDTSLITGLMGSMGMTMPGMVFPETPMSIPRMPEPQMPLQTSHERIEQTSHERIEENFFKKIEDDLRAYKDGSVSNVVERILVGLIALHKRVKMLENNLDLRKPLLRMTRKVPQEVGEEVEMPKKKVLKKPTKPSVVKPEVVKKISKKKSVKKNIRK